MKRTVGFVLSLLLCGVIFAQSGKYTIFSPEKPNGVAIICCPGGGYETVCDEHEGKGWAAEMNELGITWIVLNYRLPDGNPSIPFEDVQKTMQEIKKIGPSIGVDTSQIGIAGFSAGGHLAATYSCYSPKELKPAFQILFYPVISMRKGLTHLGSRQHLLGENPPKDLVNYYSLEKHTDSLPPTLIFVSKDDAVVSPRNTKLYIKALKSTFLMHNIFPTGNHGWGNSKDFEFHYLVILDIKTFLLHTTAKTAPF